MPSKPAINADAAQASQEPSAPVTSSRSRGLLIAAVVLAGGWILGLLILAGVSANPVTVNQRQILISDYVATATRPEADGSLLVVQQEWLLSEKLGEITVTNLDETDMPSGREFLVPLQRLGGGRYRITPTTLPNEAPLIYPATSEAETQLREILSSRK